MSRCKLAHGAPLDPPAELADLEFDDIVEVTDVTDICTWLVEACPWVWDIWCDRMDTAARDRKADLEEANGDQEKT